MKFIVMVFALLLAINGAAQTRIVAESKGDFERFEVLKSDHRIKDGAFLRFSGPDFKTVTVDGYYRDNKRDSVWKYYLAGNLVAEGAYANGSKTGVWTGYTRGYERLKYDYTTSTLLAYIPAVIDSVFLFKPSYSSKDTVLDRRPIYINGFVYLSQYLMRNIRYTTSALANGKQGEMVVTFTVDKKGRAGNFFIKGDAWGEQGKEVLRVLLQAEGGWVPGMANGKEVESDVEIPIVFEINKPIDTPHKPNQFVIIRAAAANLLR